MSICVTKNQQQPTFNIVTPIVVGAAGGYIAKNALPLTKAEKDYFAFDQFVLNRKTSVKNAVEDELAAIRETVAAGTTDKGYQTYLDFGKNAKPKEVRDAFLKDVVGKLPEEAQATFNRLRATVDKKVKEVKKVQNFVYEAAIKKSRSASVYMLTGALIATGASFVKYALDKMSAPKA